MPEKTKETLGITVRKYDDFSEWFTQVCSEQGAKLVDVRYGVQGFIVHRPWAFKILREIYKLLEEEVEADGHEPFLFPTVIPEKNLTKEKEHAGFAPDVFWVTERGSEKMEERVALRPTGESAIYPMYSLWIRSYKDLPFKRYQSRITVFRNEKTTRPFLRGREFMFFETHDVFKDHDGVAEQIRKDCEIMKRVIHDKLKIPFIFLKRPKKDKFKGAVDTFCADTVMPDGKRNQLSSTHDLGQNFAKAYKVKFRDEDGKEKHAYQTCFGPGVWRIMAAIIGIHGDDNGLILPFDIAPTQIIIIPIVFNKGKDSSENILKKCKEAEQKLKGYKVKIDDSDNTPGFKYNQYELMGVPIRLEIGPDEVKNNQVTLVKRTDKKKIKVKISDLLKEITTQKKQLDDEIKKRADEYFKENTKDAETMDELKKIIKTHRGFVRVPFCSIDNDGDECGDNIKTETGGADTCGVLFPKEELPKKGQKCIWCNKPAKHLVYVAKSY